MGPNSCRATIRDIQDPSIVGHFDLPNTAATLIEAALLARSHITEGGRRRLAAGGPSNTSPASQSPAPARAQLGIADELTKLADLHEKGDSPTRSSPATRRDCSILSRLSVGGSRGACFQPFDG